ncbi:MAG: phosphatidate cytidylyltransferase [Rhodobacteraceae bacterium]|nr:phosphatidate cytidylyltransferase [Paracoccaceae bacterium]
MSGAAMALVGIAAVWAGGMVFVILVCALCGAMVWEYACMIDPAATPRKPVLMGAGGGLVVFVLALLGALSQMGAAGVFATLGLVLAGGVLLSQLLPRDRGISGPYLALILFAGLGLILLREDFGLAWVLWLVLLVIGSDVAGYFAGRMIGGPKLWPRVSPKKTWSGTVAGWVLAALVGWAFGGLLGAGAGLVFLSVLIAMAGQAGDIAESAIKRHVGVKDSSNLIPGHGGVLDRFDAMISAALMVLILALLGALG